MTDKVKPLPCDCTQGDKIELIHDMMIKMEKHITQTKEDMIYIKTTIKPLKDNGQPGIYTRFLRAEGAFKVISVIIGLLLTVIFSLLGWLFMMINKMMEMI